MTANYAIHNSVTTGFSNATAYDTHRPSYPVEAVEILLGHLEVAGQTGAQIVDLGAGTGKLTELLAARPEGFKVLAIEPHQSMRQTLDDKSLRGVVSNSGTAEDMGLEDGTADVVVIGQAFHWFAKVDALKEIHRVLKPGGKLAMIWNIDDYNKPRSWKATTNWEHQLHELIINTATDGQPRFRDDRWRAVFDEQQGLFSTPIGEDRTEWTIWLNPDALWDRVRTLSHIAMLDGEAKDDFKAKFDKIVKEGDGRWDEKGELAMHGATPFAWATRL